MDRGRVDAGAPRVDVADRVAEIVVGLDRQDGPEDLLLHQAEVVGRVEQHERYRQLVRLKARGVQHVVASDFSPGRRRLARSCGADLAIDPAADSPYAGAGEHGHITTIPQAARLGMETTEKLRRLPVPWHHVWRTAEALGAKPTRP